MEDVDKRCFNKDTKYIMKKSEPELLTQDFPTLVSYGWVLCVLQVHSGGRGTGDLQGAGLSWETPKAVDLVFHELLWRALWGCLHSRLRAFREGRGAGGYPLSPGPRGEVLF